jgi:hypothetical protein
LDSIQNHSSGKTEGERIQRLLLKHHNGKTFREDRVSVNLAKASSQFMYLFFIHEMKQVPLQANSKDCGCFTIYFAKKFFSSPDSTMALIKVILLDPSW